MQGVILSVYSLTFMKSIDCEQKLKSETLRNVRAQVTDLEPSDDYNTKGRKPTPLVGQQSICNLALPALSCFAKEQHQLKGDNASVLMNEFPPKALRR